MTRPDSPPDERRRRILVATVEMLRERGFAGTRVTDIAEAAGTSSGLVLYHFGSLAGALAEALTHVEDAFYAELDAELDGVSGPVDRLRRLVRLASGTGPAVGDWTLWLEIWVRALRDADAAAVRDSLDRRWRALLRELIGDGVRAGVFAPADVEATTLRLASLMDGLAIQLALRDPSMSVTRFRRLWLDAAALELAVPVELLRAGAGAGSRRGGRSRVRRAVSPAS
jgi:TetR/AcrR family transcriptional repressor of bet genes